MVHSRPRPSQSSRANFLSHPHLAHQVWMYPWPDQTLFEEHHTIRCQVQRVTPCRASDPTVWEPYQG
jgi:hypothetical protein